MVCEVSKKLPDEYVYPAVFTYEDGKEIAVVFPDIELATSGTDETDALFSAREALGGRLALMEEFGDEIPKATELKDIKVESNERAVLIDVFMPSVRMAEKNRSVNRTVTLPAWLNAAAQEKNVNFSQVLQDALKEKFKLREKA